MVAIMIISYKGYVLFYVCVARMLKNAFKEWNKWAMEVLNRNQGNAYHSIEKTKICICVILII